MEILPIINNVYEIFKLAVIFNNKMEKRWRYSVGQSIEQNIMELLKELIMAKNAPKPFKAPYLIKASSYLEILTLQFRFCLESKLGKSTTVFQIQAKLLETGRMLGGWLKSLS